MRVCILSWKFPARSTTFIREHVMGLRARGHDVVVISTGPGPEIELNELKEIDQAGVRRIVVPDIGTSRIRKAKGMLGAILTEPSLIRQVFPSPPWTRSEIFQAWSYKKAIQIARPDVAHIHFGTLAGPIDRLGLPQNTIVTWHGYDANQIPQLRSVNMYREMFSSGYRHTVGSSFMRKRLERLGAPPESISQIPMGIDLRRFSPKFREPKGRLRIVSVGRLDEMKGHRFLIQAVIELIQEGEDVVLRVVGGGPLRDVLNGQIADSGCRDRIHLVGPKTSEEVIRELNDADLFALTGIVAKTGRVETQGVVYAEAQATRLPVIACDVGGVGESLVHGETGIMCPPGNVDAIKQAVKFFISNPRALSIFGDRGRAFVESRFSCDAMLDAFEGLYCGLVDPV